MSHNNSDLCLTQLLPALYRAQKNELDLYTLEVVESTCTFISDHVISGVVLDDNHNLCRNAGTLGATLQDITGRYM